MAPSGSELTPVVILIVLVLCFLLQPIIPLRRRKSGWDGFPFLTATLVFANVVVYLATMDFEWGVTEQAARQWGLVPAQFRPWTLLSHQFLHGGVDHIAANMMGLWMVGPHVEEALGRKEYALAYIGCGLAAALMHILAIRLIYTDDATEPLIGASGAVFGIIGLFAIRFWRTRVRLFLFFPVPAIAAVGVILGLQLLSIWHTLTTGERDNVAYFAHVGGFALGALLARLLQVKNDSRREYSLEDAEKALSQERPEVALFHYQSVLADSPDDGGLHHTVALLCHRLKRVDDAEAHFMKALSLLARSGPAAAMARAFWDCRQCCPLLTLPVAILQKAASACEETRQYRLAYDALADIASRPDVPTSEAETALLRLGRLYLHRLNQPADAVTLFTEFLRRYPASPMADHARALLVEARRGTQR